MKSVGFFIKCQLIFVFYLILLNYQLATAQESKVNKIIIDDNFGNGRLLSPPTEHKKKKIKLIPPKSVLEKNKKKLDDIRKVKENEEKDTETIFSTSQEDTLVNKVDNAKRAQDAVEFYSLGLGDYFTVASINGSGTGDLLDALIDCLPEENDDINTKLPRFAVVGRPNAGKSSFINALIGEERYIVTDIAGTTRDAIDTKYNRYGFEFNLVDTAGIRRKSKVKEDLEFYSVMRSVRAIENSDVCLLVIDAERGFDGQVQNIFWLAQRNNKGIVILVNKWDLVKKDTSTTKDFENYIKKQIEPFVDVPIVFISAHTKQRIFKAIETAVNVYKNRSKRIKTSQLNEDLLPVIQKTPPPALKGKYVKIKYIMQLPTPQPQFAFFCNLPQYVKDPYKRFLENKLRSMYDFCGVPVTIFMRKK